MMPEPWEFDVHAKAKDDHAVSGALARSWSPSFKRQVLWERYVRDWRAEKARRAEDSK